MKNARKTILVMVMVLVVFCLGLPEAQATVVFGDGGTHTLSSTLNDEVEVRNSPSGVPTLLNLVSGGLVKYYLRVYDSSQANISGGSTARAFMPMTAVR